MLQFTSNDKFQQLYAVTNKLHKCLNFLLELNIFKNTNNTHQKMQNSSLYTITQPLLQDSADSKGLNFLLATKQHTSHQTTRREFCNQIQMLQYIKRQDSATVCRHNKLHKCFEFFVGIKHFQKHKTTHIKRCRIHRSTRSRTVFQPDSNATIHQTT